MKQIFIYIQLIFFSSTKCLLRTLIKKLVLLKIICIQDKNWEKVVFYFNKILFLVIILKGVSYPKRFAYRIIIISKVLRIV